MAFSPLYYKKSLLLYTQFKSFKIISKQIKMCLVSESMGDRKSVQPLIAYATIVYMMSAHEVILV